MLVVPRTFTLIQGSGRQGRARVHGLDGFRDARAYVLLGVPGSGKTTVFRQEAQRLNACFVTARDFIWLDLPEWRKNTLFIDGLDETRVGSADLRRPLDQIRGKLSQLGFPRFRISCRDAEWLGANDRDALEAIAEGEDVSIVRLNPLGEEEIRKFLKAQLDADESKRIIQGAIERGILSLLENPLSLKLLAGTLSGTDWPNNRTDVFELACESLLDERNDEHVIATDGGANDLAVLSMAGQLCAFQLLTGRTGYCRVGGSSDRDFLALSELGSIESDVLNRAICSRLFKASHLPGQFVPIHRHVAEFVASRYLAGLVHNGLPVGRILSFVNGYDGRVVSEFAGVTAWLAALCKKSRLAIADAFLRLSKSTDLQAWKHRILEGQSQQAEIRRTAGFRYVSMRDLRSTLHDAQPTNAADLATLTIEELGGIARRIRDGNTSDWRQYWDFERGRQPARPRHEELCRDSLLSDLQPELHPLGINAQPEGHYADDKRADIRVSYRGLNVPIEIKESRHRELWSSARNQLVRKYTREPGSQGYGIYLVLWFGADRVPVSPDGKRPSSANRLKKSLEAALSPSERRMISIVVIDVARQPFGGRPRRRTSAQR